MSTYNKEYYEKTKEKKKLQSKQYYEKVKNTPKYKETNKAQKLVYRENNPEKILWLTSKARSVKVGMEFSITQEEIHIPEYCPYMGIPLTNIRGKGRMDSNPSLDRIDSSKGYIPGNIQVISERANRMKQDSTPEQLLAFAKGIMRMHSES